MSVRRVPGYAYISEFKLVGRIKAGLVTVLDIRPPDEFALGHLPGAVNVPLSELKRRLKDMDPKLEIVAYCRGPHCVLSYDAVAMPLRRGFQARRLEDGLPERRAAGLPRRDQATNPGGPPHRGCRAAASPYSGRDFSERLQDQRSDQRLSPPACLVNLPGGYRTF